MFRSTNAPPMWVLRIFVSLHVLTYRLSGRRLGRSMNGMPVLLLTTTGRKTGKPRTVPLVYLRDEADYVVTLGVVERPAWLLNLRAHPQAEIQVGPSRMKVKAREASDEERRQLWTRAPAYWHNYQTAAKSEFPFIFLRKIE
jgi:deazaflavin-dependent oxidoreductase (nitroreductase family)